MAKKKQQKNLPDLVVADTWMGRHRAKTGLSQKAFAALLSKASGREISRENYRAIEKTEEPNTWCAALLDLYLTEKGVALLLGQGEKK
jgi:hypothetical protein